jgi:cation:H+ antiporter
MGVALVLLAVGAAGLYAGARAAARGMAILGPTVGVPTSFLGTALLGIHLEGLATAVAAAGMGQTAIAGGQVFGGALVVAVVAFGLAPIASSSALLAPPATVVAAPAVGMVAAAFAVGGRFVSRLEGALLVALYLAYVFVVVTRGREDRGATEGEDETDERAGRRAEDDPPSWRHTGLLLLGGLGGLSIGAVALVIGGARLAAETLLLPGFIGATVVAALASLDPIRAAARARSEQPGRAGEALLGLGAATTGVLGIAALIRPLQVDSGATTSFLALAFVYAIVGTGFLARGSVGRRIGTAVVAIALAWLLWGWTL